MHSTPVGMTNQRDGGERTFDVFDRSVLQLIANGESYDEAASILSINRDRIDEAMCRARLALGALTDEHLVALALRQGLIA